MKADLKETKNILEELNDKSSKFLVLNNNFVEEEIVIDIKYVNAGAERMMLIDSGLQNQL